MVGERFRGSLVEDRLLKGRYPHDLSDDLQLRIVSENPAVDMVGAIVPKQELLLFSRMPVTAEFPEVVTTQSRVLVFFECLGLTD